MQSPSSSRTSRAPGASMPTRDVDQGSRTANARIRHRHARQTERLNPVDVAEACQRSVLRTTGNVAWRRDGRQAALGAGRRVPERAGDHARQLDPERGAADVGAGVARLDVGVAVDRRRVHLGVRGTAAGGRKPGRPLRASPGAADRSGRLRHRVGRGGVLGGCDGPGGVPGSHGRRGGPDPPDFGRGPDQRVHQCRGAGPGTRRLVGDRGAGPGARSGAGRGVAVAVLVGFGVPGQRADRGRGAGGGLVGDPGVPEPGGVTVRSVGCGALGAQRVGVGLGNHRGPDRGVGVGGDAPFVRGRDRVVRVLRDLGDALRPPDAGGGVLPESALLGGQSDRGTRGLRVCGNAVRADPAPPVRLRLLAADGGCPAGPVGRDHDGGRAARPSTRRGRRHQPRGRARPRHLRGGVAGVRDHRRPRRLPPRPRRDRWRSEPGSAS